MWSIFLYVLCIDIVYKKIEVVFTGKLCVELEDSPPHSRLQLGQFLFKFHNLVYGGERG